jgi:hypothetical protein
MKQGNNVPRCNEKRGVCFYFFEKLKIFKKIKTNPLPSRRSVCCQETGFYPVSRISR